MVDQYPDPKDQYPEETREWLESLAAVIDREGAERAHFLLDRLVELIIGACSDEPGEPSEPDEGSGSLAMAAAGP